MRKKVCINSDNFQRILAMAKAAIAPKNRLMISVTPQTRTEFTSARKMRMSGMQQKILGLVL